MLPHTSFSARLWVVGKDIAHSVWELGLLTLLPGLDFLPREKSHLVPGSTLSLALCLMPDLYLLYYSFSSTMEAGCYETHFTAGETETPTGGRDLPKVRVVDLNLDHPDSSSL